MSTARKGIDIDTNHLADQICIYLKNYYCLPAKFQKQEELETLGKRLKSQFSQIKENLTAKNLTAKSFKEEFAKAATALLHKIDEHLELALAENEHFQRLLKNDELIYSPEKNSAYFRSTVSTMRPNLDGNSLKNQLREIQEKNFGFDENPDTRLPDEIGYFKITQFYDPYLGKDTNHSNKAPVEQKAYDIMNKMQGKKALIIDLRDCPGGSPELMRYLISFFFTKNTPINKYNRRIDGNIEEFKTIPQDFKLAMPVYILTNSETFSAAESFSYSMQQFSEYNVQGTKGRITLVGQQTGGGAHRYYMFPLIDNDPRSNAPMVNTDWCLLFPITNNINFYSKTNWEDGPKEKGEAPGVRPHIQISPGQDALKVVVDKINTDSLRQTAPRFFSAPQQASTKKNDELEISDEAMAKSAFGQSSNTAKAMKKHKS